MDLKSMKCDPRPDDSPSNMICSDNEYPYGLCLNLEDEQIKKLGISKLPEVGETMTLTAKVEVSSLSQRDTREGGKKSSLSLQITDMAVEKSQPGAGAAQVLYGGENS